MTTQDYWQLFLETGAPEAYLLFHHARRMEHSDVCDDQGPGFAGHSLQ